MYKISELAKKFHLSRTTILYYDSIGLLSPDRRTSSGYRLYSEKSARKLQRICELRNAGLDLKKIKVIVHSKSSKRIKALQQRLGAINFEINNLRKQQEVIIDMLQDKSLQRKARVMTKERWIAILRQAGLDNDGLHKWHQAFELSSPEAHQDFLESIGLPDKEIQKIRSLSRK